MPGCAGRWAVSDLTQFRDHARFMAGQDHAPGCLPARSKPSKTHRFDSRHIGWKWCGRESEHDKHEWRGVSLFGTDYAPEWNCQGICGGCALPAERALWTKLADEVDEHLADRVEVDLFGEMANEPKTERNEGDA